MNAAMSATSSGFWAGRKVLVAGATGLIGSNLTARLLAEGATVRATLHRRAPVVGDGRVEYVPCDLTRMDDCRRGVADVRYVFLCAANTSGAAAIAASPLAHVTPNVVMNTQMLEAAYAAGVEKVLWLSSSIVYPETDRAATEDMGLDGEPYGPYFFAGWMKRFSEILCRMYGEKLARPMTAIVLRPTNVYGPHDKFDPAVSHVTAALIRKVVERHDPIEVWGTGEDERDLVYVDDMVAAMLTAMERLDGYSAINIGAGRTYSVRAILKLLLELDGYEKAAVTFDTSKPSMIRVKKVDITRARTLLGFEPHLDLREGLRRTIDWYRERCNLERNRDGG